MTQLALAVYVVHHFSLTAVSIVYIAVTYASQAGY